jgi:hypothetical protein
MTILLIVTNGSGSHDDPKVEKPFIISFPPKYIARSPFGRATRPMLAFDLEVESLVFLKDYWRVDMDGMGKEGDIYTILESHRVPNIAPFGKGNDHMTLTGMRMGVLVDRNGTPPAIQNASEHR